MKYLALAVAAAAFSVSLQAAEIKYDYVEAGYQKTNFDESLVSDFTPTGYAIAGSKQIGNWFVAGKYSSVSKEITYNDYDLQRFDFSVGFIQTITERTKLDYSVSLGQIKAKTSVAASEYWSAHSATDSADTLQLNAQVRHLLADQFEVNAGLGFERINDDQSENYFVYKVGAQYYVTEQLSVNATYRNTEDYNELSFNIRYNF